MLMVDDGSHVNVRGVHRHELMLADTASAKGNAYVGVSELGETNTCAIRTTKALAVTLLGVCVCGGGDV